MAGSSALHDLIALAQEPSSARRRELLRRVTDIFLSAPPPPSSSEAAAFDGVLCTLAHEVEGDVRVQLAHRFAAADGAPARLAAELARDCIEVALPILSNARLLTEADLLEVAKTRDQDHLRAVSSRPDVTEAISDVIVERGDDATLGVLVANASAPLSRTASEAVVRRAIASPELQEVVVGRESLPLDLLNELYTVVEARLRQRIRDRNAAASPEAVEAALRLTRARMTARLDATEPDLVAANAEVASLAARRRLHPPALLAFLRAGRRTHFCAGLAYLAELETADVRGLIDRGDLDGLAVLCKAADMERSMFLTFAVLTIGGRDAINRVAAYGKLYAELSRDTAQRTLRFWRVRADALAA